MTPVLIMKGSNACQSNTGLWHYYLFILLGSTASSVPSKFRWHWSKHHNVIQAISKF